jgi:hypothetical protein
MKKNIQMYLYLLASIYLAACNAVEDSGVTDPDHGMLRVALEYQNDAGVIYYLRDAHLTVIGEQETSIEVGDESVVRTSLAPGDYALELDAGWWIEREEAGVLEPIEAELLSPNPTSFSIVSGEETAVSLQFLVAGEAIAFEPGELVVNMQIEVADGGLSVPDEPGYGEHLVINEVDYDQAGTDDSEFIEIYNPTSSAVSTDGLVLELINGADGAAQVYGSSDLAQAGESIPALGYLVIASESLIQTLPEGVLSLPLPRSIQNGDPDGVRISDNSGIVDSLSYGGFIDGVTEGDSAPTDTEEGSIGRCVNGTDSDDNATDFRAIQPSTPGSENICTGAGE